MDSRNVFPINDKSLWYICELFHGLTIMTGVSIMKNVYHTVMLLIHQTLLYFLYERSLYMQRFKVMFYLHTMAM